MNASRTMFFLLAEFGTGQIPLDQCCHHFGLAKEKAKQLAARQALPVPAFRLGSQKSPWLIDAEKLAAYIDKQRTDAEFDWKKINAA